MQLKQLPVSISAEVPVEQSSQAASEEKDTP